MSHPFHPSRLAPALLALAFVIFPVKADIGTDTINSSLSGTSSLANPDADAPTTSTKADVNTLRDQYEDTTSLIYFWRAKAAGLQTDLNNGDKTVKGEYFKALTTLSNLENKSEALDSLISSKKLEDSSLKGQALSEADYVTLKNRLAYLNYNRKQIEKQQADIINRLNAGGDTAELNQLELLNKQSAALSKEAEKLRTTLNNSTYPDGKPSVAPASNSSGSSNDPDDSNVTPSAPISSGVATASNDSSNNFADTFKNALAQAAQQQLLGGGNFGGLSGITGGLSGLTASLGNLAGNTTTGNLGSTPSTNTTTPAATGSTGNLTKAQIAAEKAKVEKEKAAAKACSAPGTTRPKGTTETSPGKAADDDLTAGGKTAATTDTSPGKAADDDLTSGGKVATTTPAATDTAAPATTADTTGCRPPDVTTANPVSKGKTVSLTDAQALEALHQCLWNASNTEAYNKCECASLAKDLAGLGRASTWKQGLQATPGMAPGAIATMQNGGYCSAANPGGIHGCHAAYFIGTINGQNKVIEQYDGSGGPHVTTWSDAKLAKYSRIISGAQTSMLLFHPFLEAPLWIVLNLKPYTMGLLRS